MTAIQNEHAKFPHKSTSEAMVQANKQQNTYSRYLEKFQIPTQILSAQSVCAQKE